MAMAMELAGTSVLVTGGSGGLGAAAVRAFHAAGAAVVIADVAEQPSKTLAEELGERALYAWTDVTDSASVEAALATASGLGVLRTVVVAHGGWPSGSWTAAESPRRWRTSRRRSRSTSSGRTTCCASARRPWRATSL
jgi:NAD(P)-dependent dehydrogenase (short-subunit alcohol dehydrogenase family)